MKRRGEESSAWATRGSTTESNKLFMKWKGPYGVLAKIDANDYRINVNGEGKAIHGNLLKRYITRDTVNDETGGGLVSTTNLAVVEDDDEGSSCDDCDCEVLLEIDGWGSKDMVDDLSFGDGLSTRQ
ncbi:Zinc finger protein [Plakobranchus ocellatus]|uniref:Zinc finger protein n=1 Tax=Plakobranchus ocellatus TaxID=259542 RepID=A0AAV4BY08_9GAST|nr:Zinc finger protein [Plakobranchus ocellatus]